VRIWFVISIAAAGVFIGCHKSAPAKPLDVHPLPRIEIDAKRSDLVFSYVDPDGHYHDVSKLDEVPADRRKQVLVRDLSKKPEEVQSDEYLFVADLTRDTDGGYPYAVVSRYGFDRVLKQMALSGELDSPLESSDGGEDHGVVLYGTSWCGACAAARQFFSGHGIKFVDKDIEKDPKAQAELLRKAKRAGVAINGVPVIDFRGTLMLGFDQGRLEQLLKGA
jgi:mycoredoxin